MDGVEDETKMSTESRKDKLVNQEVTYTLFKDGQFYIVENVPARVDLETGEQYFPLKRLSSFAKSF